MRHVVVSLLACLLLSLVSSPAFAQPPGPAAQVEAEAPFGVGDVDALVAVGLGGFLYPHVEPAVDIGLIPLGGDVAMSLGGGADLGYCLLCEGISIASQDVDVTSFYVWPYARGLVHVGTLGGLLTKGSRDITIDLYAGLMAGPSFYNFDITSQTSDDSAGFTAVTLIAGPLLGARLGFSENTLLVFAEYRTLLEIGYGATSVTVDGTTYEVDDDYTRTTGAAIGSDLLLGVGFRF